MSIETLKQLMAVQRDDLVSLGIVLMQLNGAHIPWMNLSFKPQDGFERIEIMIREKEKHPMKVR